MTDNQKAQIIKLRAAGNGYGKIAQTLGISLNTVKCILRSPTAASAVANGSRAALSGSGNATRSSAAAGAGPTAAERW